MFIESLKYMSGLIMVKCESSTCMNIKIVHVDFEPLFSNHVIENVIYKCLECRRSIVETEEHDHGFIKTERGDESCFPLVQFLDSNVVVTLLNVKLGKVNRVLHIINEFGDERQWIGIVNCIGI